MERVYYALRDQGQVKEALDMVRYEWDHLHRDTVLDVCPCEDFLDEDIEPVLMNEPETGSREFALYMTEACDQPQRHLERAVELGMSWPRTLFGHSAIGLVMSKRNFFWLLHEGGA